MKIHTLKILPKYFEAVLSGQKNFEIRRNDRHYQSGDQVCLQEYTGDTFTGRSLSFQIGYVADYMQMDNVVVFSLLPITEVAA